MSLSRDILYYGCPGLWVWIMPSFLGLPTHALRDHAEHGDGGDKEHEVVELVLSVRRPRLRLVATDRSARVFVLLGFCARLDK